MKSAPFRKLAFAAIFALSATAAAQARAPQWFSVHSSHLVPETNRTAVHSVRFPFFADLFTNYEVADLQGVTRVQTYWWDSSTPQYWSGGSVNGGNIYKDKYVPGTVPAVYRPQLLGPSGFKSVKALAVQPSIYSTWWSSGYWGRWGGWGWWSWFSWWWNFYPQIFLDRLYGAASTSNDVSDRLIKIDPITGAGTLVGTFGTTPWGQKIQDIEGMAFHPTTGVLYGITGRGFDGTSGDLFIISTTTGAASWIGSLDLGAEATGICFDYLGDLYGVTGDSSNPAKVGATFSINLNTMSHWYYWNSALGVPCSDLCIYGRM